MRSSTIEMFQAAGFICIMTFCLLLIKQGKQVESLGKLRQHIEQEKQMNACSDKDTKQAKTPSTCLDVESMCPVQMQQMPLKSLMLPEMWESLEWESARDSFIWDGVTKLGSKTQIESGYTSTQTSGSTLIT